MNSATTYKCESLGAFFSEGHGNQGRPERYGKGRRDQTKYEMTQTLRPARQREIRVLVHTA